jgi:hypothetical protein
MVKHLTNIGLRSSNKLIKNIGGESLGIFSFSLQETGTISDAK